MTIDQIKNYTKQVTQDISKFRPIMSDDGDLPINACFIFFNALQAHRVVLRSYSITVEVAYLEKYDDFLKTDTFKSVKHSSTMAEKAFNAYAVDLWRMLAALKSLIEEIDSTLREYTSLMALARENINKGLTQPKDR